MTGSIHDYWPPSGYSNIHIVACDRGDAIWDRTLIRTVSEKAILYFDSMMLYYNYIWYYNYGQLYSKCKWSMKNLTGHFSKKTMAPV